MTFEALWVVILGAMALAEEVATEVAQSDSRKSVLDLVLPTTSTVHCT